MLLTYISFNYAELLNKIKNNSVAFIVASFVIGYNCFKTDPISIQEYIVIHHNNTSKVNTMDNLVK